MSNNEEENKRFKELTEEIIKCSELIGKQKDTYIMSVNPELIKIIYNFEEHQKCAEDIIYFIEKYITLDGLNSIKLKEFQKDIIKDNIIMNKKSRNLGFTTMSILKIIHTIIFNSDRYILYVSHTFKTFSFKLFEDLFNSCTYPYKPKMTTDNKTNKRFDNDSGIIATTYNSVSNIRGYSFTDVYLDEYDFVKRFDFDDYLKCLIPAIRGYDSNNIVFWMFSNKCYKNYQSKLIPRKIKKTAKQYDYWVVNDELYLKYKELIKSLSEKEVKDEYGLSLKMKG